MADDIIPWAVRLRKWLKTKQMAMTPSPKILTSLA